MSIIDTIVVPQGAEYHAVCRGLQRANANIQVLPIPIGSDRAADILTDYTPQLKNARRVLIMGLCGSLVATYRVGDLVTIKSCCNPRGDWLDLDRELTATLAAKLSVPLVKCLTGDRPTTRTREKQKLARRYSVSVVEMEGYGYTTRLRSKKAKL